VLHCVLPCPRVMPRSLRCREDDEEDASPSGRESGTEEARWVPGEAQS
jgi:hypothetical protein